MKFGKSRLFALAAAHGASLLAVPAVLQAAETSGQLEEIVVTARQREEKIEDVPVTITAFTRPRSGTPASSARSTSSR